jgi:hypothetical protein
MERPKILWNCFIILPVCTVATAVKAMCKYRGRVFGSDSNPRSQTFNLFLNVLSHLSESVVTVTNIGFEIMADLQVLRPALSPPEYEKVVFEFYVYVLRASC